MRLPLRSMVSKNIFAGRTHKRGTGNGVKRTVHDHLFKRLGILGESLKAVMAAFEVYELASDKSLLLFCHLAFTSRSFSISRDT